MPDSDKTCVLPDGTTVDLSGATLEEAQACLTNPSTTLRLEMDVDDQSLTHSNRKVKAMDPANETIPVHAQPTADAAPVESHAPQGTTAHETQMDAPSIATNEIAQLVQSAGGGAIGLAAALIAVVGGTAAFKLWTKISEQKHEQSMKKLEIEQANAGLSGAQPPPCQAAHQALVAEIKGIQAKVAELEGRTGKVEKSTAGINPSVDVDDLEDRVKVIEKSLRRKAPASGGV